MLILSVESSCDENSAAIIRDGKVLSLVTVTQQVHIPFGGVVPELAGRSHLELQDYNVQRALAEAQVSLRDVTHVAATAGPGLVGSLLVGHSYAQALATTLNVPLISTHHMEGHLWSVEIDRDPLPLPFLILLVSGGHTMLVIVKGFRDYVILGATLDDALGEAYDKVGKLLGMGFPAGAEIDRRAKQGDANAIPFPVSMRDDSYNFSFSGLKTAVAYKLRDEPHWSAEEHRNDLLASFQRAAMQSVLEKSARAAKYLNVRAVAAAGGVAANSELRTGLTRHRAGSEHRFFFSRNEILR
jgi:N6-L-threonylcarbamoyladenine synthase